MDVSNDMITARSRRKAGMRNSECANQGRRYAKNDEKIRAISKQIYMELSLSIASAVGKLCTLIRALESTGSRGRTTGTKLTYNFRSGKPSHYWIIDKRVSQQLISWGQSKLKEDRLDLYFDLDITGLQSEAGH